MNGLYNNMINQLATSDYYASRRIEADKKKQIAELELQLETPMNTLKYMREARLLANSTKKKPTEEDIERIAAGLYARDQEGLRAQLEYLQQGAEASEEDETPADDGGFSVEVNGTVTTRAMVQEAIEAVGEAETRRKLKNAGLNEGQITALIKGDLSIGSEETRAKTNEELIMEGGGINPYRAQRKLSQSPLAPSNRN
jgi:hypothetical protein